MIDIHNHILFNVDDGVKSLKNSLEILRHYEKIGINAVLLTPHYAPKRGYYKTKEELNAQFLKLKKACEDAAIKVRLFLGSEIDYSPNYLDDIKLAPSLNETNIVLIDFGVGESDIEEAIYELSIRNYKVIVAHAERYKDISIETLKKVRALGGVIQVNARHLVKKGSKMAQKKAKALLKEDLIDIVASDLHRFEQVETMDAAYQHIRKKRCEKLAQQLFINTPKKVLDGSL